MKTLLVSIGVVMLLMAGVIGFMGAELNQDEDADFGGVNIGNEYLFTQYTAAVATTTEVLDGRGMLGSVIITEDQAGAVVLIDATSTTAYSRTNGTRIADFEAAQAEGVYNFDVRVKNGIILEAVNGWNFAGDWTITYRQY